jgi:hypothetical protein
VGASLLAMVVCQAAWLFDGVHIRFCGNGHLWFRSYSGSLGKAPSNQGLLPLTFGASPRLGIPSRGGVHRNSVRGGLPAGLVLMLAHSPVGAVECNEAAIFWLYYLQTRSKDRSLRQLLRSDTSAKSGRLAGRLREQARSYRGAKTEQPTPRCSSPLIRPSVSSPAALDLDPPAPSEG